MHGTVEFSIDFTNTQYAYEKNFFFCHGSFLISLRLFGCSLLVALSFLDHCSARELTIQATWNWKNTATIRFPLAHVAVTSTSLQGRVHHGWHQRCKDIKEQSSRRWRNIVYFHQKPKNFQYSPSHRIFRHMHRLLNIDKIKTNCTVWSKLRRRIFWAYLIHG
jgi:hypothetical protein